VFDLRNIFSNREIDAWRDRHILIAGKVLNQLAVVLIDDLVQDCADASWDEALFSTDTFIATRIVPRVKAATEPVVEQLVADANCELGAIVEHRAVWSEQVGHLPVPRSAVEPIGDLASAAVPLAGGAALAAALPAAAITTTGGLLGTGLFATTVVAWPVVVVGGAAIGLAFATGLVNAGQIRSKAGGRLHRQVGQHIAAMLIRGTPEAKSILEQLTDLYKQTAQEAKALR
jgi:hypothetical protein